MRMFHARNDHIVSVPALAGDKALVFLAKNAGANAFNTHDFLLLRNSE